MPRTLTKPLDDGGMWRRAVARAHPDAGGDGELFTWLQAVRETVCGGRVTLGKPSREHASQGQDEPERIPYDPALGHVDEFVLLTMRALSVGQRVEEPYSRPLALLIDCPASDHGRQAARQCRGASYRQLARIGYSLGWSKAQRLRFYELCRSIPLSDAHASHILNRLGLVKGRAA